MVAAAAAPTSKETLIRLTFREICCRFGIRFNGNPKRQHISRKVKRVNVSFDLGTAAAAATMVLVVRSTHVTIQLFPNLVVGKGPIMSMAQLVNGCTGIAENCGIPKR